MSAEIIASRETEKNRQMKQDKEMEISVNMTTFSMQYKRDLVRNPPFAAESPSANLESSGVNFHVLRPRKAFVVKQIEANYGTFSAIRMAIATIQGSCECACPRSTKAVEKNTWAAGAGAAAYVGSNLDHSNVRQAFQARPKT